MSGGRNKGLNFENVVVKPKTAGYRYHGSGAGIGRKMKCWRCGGEHMKRGYPKHAEEKEEKKDEGGVDGKRA